MDSHTHDTFERLRVRKEQCVPFVADLEARLRWERSHLWRSATVSQPIDNLLRRWERFTGFSGDGRIRQSNGAVERALRGLLSVAGRGSSAGPNLERTAPPLWPRSSTLPSSTTTIRKPGLSAESSQTSSPASPTLRKHVGSNCCSRTGQQSPVAKNLSLPD